MVQQDLSGRDYVLVSMVVIFWGLNFVAIKIGLSGFPPLFLVGIRFGLVFFPACLWIKPPKVPLKLIFWYAFFLGIGQFGFLFNSIRLGMPSGVASVLLQSQVVFSLPLAVVFLKEKITPIQIGGIMISVFGVLVLGGLFHRETALPLVPFILMIAAAFCFGASNVLYRRIVDYNNSQGKKTNALEVLVWASMYVPIPMFILSFFVETPEVVFAAIKNLQAPAIISLFYMVVLSTLVGYSLWSSLIGKHSSSKIAPFSLLVPLVGVLASYWILNETITPLQIVGIIITISGLVVANTGMIILEKLGLRSKSSR